jgi:hypothetical protein
MDSENKYLLLISVGPKIAQIPSEDGTQADPPRPEAAPCAGSLRASTRLFGATEIEGGFPHSEIHGSKPVRGSP